MGLFNPKSCFDSLQIGEGEQEKLEEGSIGLEYVERNLDLSMLRNLEKLKGRDKKDKVSNIRKKPR